MRQGKHKTQLFSLPVPPAMLPFVLANGQKLDPPRAPIIAIPHCRAPQNRAELKQVARFGRPRKVAGAGGWGVRCPGFVRRFLSLNLWQAELVKSVRDQRRGGYVIVACLRATWPFLTDTFQTERAGHISARYTVRCIMLPCYVDKSYYCRFMFLEVRCRAGETDQE